MRRWMGIVTLVLALPFGAVAQEVSARVDRSVVSADGDPFFIMVSASGGRVAEPVIPHADGVFIQRTPVGRSNNTTVQFQNGTSSMVKTMTWSYKAQAQREGTLTIPAITVNIDGKKYASDPIEVRSVKPASPSVPTAGGDDTPRNPTVDDAIRIRAEVSSQDVYVGEAVELELQFLQLNSPGVMTRYMGGRSIPAPTTEGFYAVPSLPEELPDRVEEANGFSYRVSSWGQRLFPTRAGELTIGSWRWKGSISAHTRRGPLNQAVEKVTEPVVVRVRPLPDPPAGFSGAVGQFTCQATLNNRSLTQGLPEILRVVVRGQGNPDGIGAPKIDAIDWAQLSGPTIDIRDLGKNQGVEKTFSFSLTPIEAGDHSVPRIDFIYFLPAISQYKTVSTNTIPCTVTASNESVELVVSHGALDATPGSVKVLGSDIRTIVTTPRGLRTRRSGVPLNLALSVLPPLGFIAFGIVVQRRKRLTQDTGFARQYYARNRSRKRLAAIQKSGAPTETLYKAMTGYIADTFNVNEAGMTSGDARAVMLERGLPAEVIDTAVKVLKSCERAHYGGAELSVQEIGALTDAAASMMDRTDALVKKGRK